MKEYIFIDKGRYEVGGIITYWVDYLNQDLEHPRILRVEFTVENDAESFISTLNKQ
jgi:hypothetical protein